jgi:hypothetical protein
MMDDMIDSALNDDIEEETEEEVDKVCPSLASIHRLEKRLHLSVKNVSLHVCQLLFLLSRAHEDDACRLQVLLEIAGETLQQLAGSAAPKQKQNIAETGAQVAEDDDLHGRLDAVRN